MSQVTESQSSFDKFVLASFGIILSIAASWAAILTLWNSSFWLGLLVLIGGLLLGIVSFYYLFKYLRKSRKAKEYTAWNILDFIIDIFR